MALNTPSLATCNLCSELYTDPRMLECLHSFCSKCLKKFLEEHDSETEIKCPQCKKTASLPEGGVNALPKDLRKSYEAEVAQYANRIQSEKEIGCDQCVEVSNGPAVSFCVNCCEFLCQACTKHHKTWRKTLNHELEPVGSAKTESKNKKAAKLFSVKIPHKPMNCQLHEDESLKFYCKTCSTLICRDCMAIEHAGHTYDRVEKVAEKEKADLLSTLKSADGARDRLDDASAKVGKVMQQIQCKQKTIEEEVRSTFKLLVEAILKREKVILAKAAEISLGKQTALTMQTEELSALRKEIAETCEMIAAASQVYTPAEMLAAKGLMKNKLVQLLKEHQGLDLEPSRSEMMSNVLDVSELVEKISSFGMVVGGSHPGEAKSDLYLPRAIVGKEKAVTITTCDVHGKPFPHGGERVEVALSLMGSNDKALTQKVVDNKNGTYVAYFTPQCIGEHQLSITIDCMHIKGSPFPIYVRQGRDYSSLTNQMSFSLSSNPFDVAVDDNGDVYVSVYGYHCIEVYNRSGNRIRTIGTAGSNGRGKGQFYSPSAIAIQGSMLYVVEHSNHRVQKLTTLGEFISEFGTYGSGEGQLNSPRGICLDANGRVFVSECGNNRISVFEVDGTFVYHISGSTTNGSNLNGPWGLAFDCSGNLHVAETNTNIIKVFTLQGEYVTSYNSQVTYPAGIAIDDEGNTFIAENNYINRSRSRNCMYAQSCLCVLNSQHQIVNSFRFVQNATGVTVDREGSVYLCGYNNSSVYKYC